MASSIPAALDYLVTQIRLLPAAAAPVVVSDGWPTQRGDAMIALGIQPDDNESEVTVAYAQLSGDMQEDVELPCGIFVRRSGTGAASAARTAAFGILDAVRDLIKSDRRLGGAVTTGLPARIARYVMQQTAEPREAGDGRWCEIRFVVAWQHRG